MAQIIINLSFDEYVMLDEHYRSEGGIELRLNDFCGVALEQIIQARADRIKQAVDAYMEVGQDTINKAAGDSLARFFREVANG